MSRFHSYIASAIKLIDTYTRGKPLQLHIRSFFAADKKFGSRDRRMISSLCYSYFRTGHAFDDVSKAEKILNGLFLCEHTSNDLLRFFRPDLDEKISLPLTDKIAITGISKEVVFSLKDELGEAVRFESYAWSFLQQPQLYLRIRPGRKKQVTDQLNKATVSFELINDSLVLANNVAADKILKLNKDAVVQDINSQKVLDYLDKLPGYFPATQKVKAWDCCAASGGKSILLFDKLKGNIQLTVSDIRDNILANLSKRLQQAGININRSFVTDLLLSSGLAATEKFSLIICDAPCTGSGTWGRSPEQLHFFDKKMIGQYAGRQQQIVSNVLPHLEEKGIFFYITCSVFKKENEGMVSYLEEKIPQLQLLEMKYLDGYENLADTMFVAVFQLS